LTGPPTYVIMVKPTHKRESKMTDLEKLEYIHSTLQDMEHIFGIEDDMVSESIAFVEELRESHLTQQEILKC